MARSFRFRITPEGVDELKRQLEALGPAGSQAFEAIKQSAPGLTDALTRAEQQSQKTKEALERLAAAERERAIAFERSRQAAQNAQVAFNAALGVDPTRGLGAAARSAAVFQEAAATSAVVTDRLAGVAQKAGLSMVGFAAGFTSGEGALKNFVKQATLAAGLFGGALTFGITAAAAAAIGLAESMGNVATATDRAREAETRYEQAIKAANELLLTREELAAQEANQKRLSTIATVAETIATEKSNIAHVQQLFLLQAVAQQPTGKGVVSGAQALIGDDDLDKLLAEANARLLDLTSDFAKLTQSSAAMHNEMNKLPPVLEGVAGGADDAARSIEGLGARYIEFVGKIAGAAKRTGAELDLAAGIGGAVGRITEEAKARQKALEEAAAAAERMGEAIRRQAESVATDIVEFSTDAFVSIENEGKGAFDNIWEGALASAKRFFVRLAAEALLRPIVLPIATQILGGSAGGSAVPGAGGGLSFGGLNFGSLGNFNLGSWLSSAGSTIPPTARGGQGVPGGTGPQVGGFSWGGAGLTAAMNLIPLGLAALNGDRLGGGQIGSAVLGTIGGIGGAFLGPVGSIIGSGFGGLVGELRVGLFTHAKEQSA